MKYLVYQIAAAAVMLLSALTVAKADTLGEIAGELIPEEFHELEGTHWTTEGDIVVFMVDPPKQHCIYGPSTLTDAGWALYSYEEVVDPLTKEPIFTFFFSAGPMDNGQSRISVAFPVYPKEGGGYDGCLRMISVNLSDSRVPEKFKEPPGEDL